MAFVYKNCTENLSLHVRVIKYALIKYWIYLTCCSTIDPPGQDECAIEQLSVPFKYELFLGSLSIFLSLRNAFPLQN